MPYKALFYSSIALPLNLTPIRASNAPVAVKWQEPETGPRMPVPLPSLPFYYDHSLQGSHDSALAPPFLLLRPTQLGQAAQSASA